MLWACAAHVLSNRWPVSEIPCAYLFIFFSFFHSNMFSSCSVLSSQGHHKAITSMCYQWYKLSSISFSMTALVTQTRCPCQGHLNRRRTSSSDLNNLSGTWTSLRTEVNNEIIIWKGTYSDKMHCSCNLNIFYVCTMMWHMENINYIFIQKQTIFSSFGKTPCSTLDTCKLQEANSG